TECFSAMIAPLTALGRHDDAAVLLGAAAARQPAPTAEPPELTGAAEVLRQRLGDERFAAARERGRRLTADDAVAFAVAAMRSSGAPDTFAPDGAGSR